MPAGRPSEYTQELGNKICAEIVEGYSLRTICKPDEMPCVATIFNWFQKHPEFLEQYERSKQIQADTLAEDLLDIADNGSNDWMERNDPNNPGYVANGEHIQRSRLRSDVRKWIASKLKPKKYGERTIVQGDADADPIKQQVEIDASARIAEIIGQLATAKATSGT